MPKPTNKKKKINAEISHLEKQLKKMNEELLLEDEVYGDYENLDADFFDIEMEAGSSKREKDSKLRKPESKRGRPQFLPRGRGRGYIRGRGRGTRRPFRGSFLPPIRAPQEGHSSRKPDLYNDDEEDWSRYVSSSMKREEKSREDFRKSSREDKSGQEEKDMFYFPTESSDKKSAPGVEKLSVSSSSGGKEKTNDSEANKPSNVMSIFQELQAKLSSAGSDIPGIDILSETLKKLERLNEPKSGKPLVAKTEEEPTSTSDSKPETLERRLSFSFAKSSAKLVKRNEKFLEKNDEVKQKNSVEKKIVDNPEEKSDLKDDSSPMRKVSYKSYQVKESQSPRREEKRKDLSPRKDSSPSSKRDSPSSERRRHGSPSKRGRSPSPRRRKSPSPYSRRRHDSISPPRRRRRSSSRSPHRRWEPDRYYKRRRSRSRSRSRSPRRGYRRRSSSRSPHRRYNSPHRGYGKRKGRTPTPLSLSPSPERRLDDWQKAGDAEWFGRQQPPVDPLAQPAPPGGETSDVYAEKNYSIPAIAPAIPPAESVPSTIVPIPSTFDPIHPSQHPTSLGPGYPPFSGPPPSQFAPPPFHPPMMHLPSLPGPPASGAIPIIHNPIPPKPPRPALPPITGPLSNVQRAENIPSSSWNEGPAAYPEPSHIPSHPPSTQHHFSTKEDSEEAKKRAVENEMKQQKLTLMKQRKEYVGKQIVLKTELEKLGKQKRELMAEKRSDNEPIIQKNNKLQDFSSSSLPQRGIASYVTLGLGIYTVHLYISSLLFMPKNMQILLIVTLTGRLIGLPEEPVPMNSVLKIGVG